MFSDNKSIDFLIISQKSIYECLLSIDVYSLKNDSNISRNILFLDKLSWSKNPPTLFFNSAKVVLDSLYKLRNVLRIFAIPSNGHANSFISIISLLLLDSIGTQYCLNSYSNLFKKLSCQSCKSAYLISISLFPDIL